MWWNSSTGYRKSLTTSVSFSANDEFRKAWNREGDTYLGPNGRGHGKMLSNFLPPFGWLDLSSMSEEEKEKVIEKQGWEPQKLQLFESCKWNKGFRVDLNFTKGVQQGCWGSKSGLPTSFLVWQCDWSLCLNNFACNIWSCLHWVRKGGRTLGKGSSDSSSWRKSFAHCNDFIPRLSWEPVTSPENGLWVQQGVKMGLEDWVMTGRWAKIHQISNGTANVVNLDKGRSICQESEDKWLPCRQAIFSCREFNLEPNVYVN